MRTLWVCFFVACGDNGMPRDAPIRDEVALVPANPNSEVDLLLVLQSSCCALDKQTALKNAMGRLVADLDALPGGRPSLHIGVISSDLGTTAENAPAPAPPVGTGPGSCAADGDGGALLKGTDQANTLVSGTFIVDNANSDGSRTTNVSAGTSLPTAIAALTSIGASGCAYEQHLRAARVALENPTNAGFRRADAALAIVFLAEDEDCSAGSTELFGSDPTFGPAGTFRCVGFGVTCDDGGTTPEEMREPGLKSQCHSNDESSLIAPVAPFVDAFTAHVADPRQLLLAVIAGEPAPVEVILGVPPGGGTPTPRVRPSCTVSGSQGAIIAEPGVRMVEAAQMARRHVIASSCAADYIEAAAAIARQIRGLVGDTCFAADISLPANCLVTDEREDGTTTAIPACTPSRTSGCYDLVHDANCTTDQQLRVDVRRTAPALPGTMVSVRCAPATSGKR